MKKYNIIILFLCLLYSYTNKIEFKLKRKKNHIYPPYTIVYRLFLKIEVQYMYSHFIFTFITANVLLK